MLYESLTNIPYIIITNLLKLVSSYTRNAMEVSFCIENSEDISFLKNKGENLQGYLCAAVSIGLKSMQMGEVRLDCHSYIDPLKETVNTINERVQGVEDRFTEVFHLRKNSSRKGRVTEHITIDALRDHYKGVEFIDVAKEGYGGDCRGKHSFGDVLYEFKDYDSLVGHAEIDKFYRDLVHTGVKYGVFVSNNSRITGKRQVEWEIRDGKIVVFVSDMGPSGMGALIATEFLIALSQYVVTEGNQHFIIANDINLDTFQRNLCLYIEEYRSNHEKLSRIRSLFKSQLEKTKAMNEEIDREIYKCLLDQESTFERMLSLTREIQERSPSECREFDRELFLESQEGKKRNIYVRLLQIAEIVGLEPRLVGSCDTKEIGFYRNELVAVTKSTKARVDLYVEITQEPLSLNYPIETIKSDKIYIVLSDNPQVFEYVRRRFSQ
jgi:hypothetical protein